jgi:hypothetical protein
MRSASYRTVKTMLKKRMEEVSVLRTFPPSEGAVSQNYPPLPLRVLQRNRRILVSQLGRGENRHGVSRGHECHRPAYRSQLSRRTGISN